MKHRSATGFKITFNWKTNRGNVDSSIETKSVPMETSNLLTETG
jgi:hypothetical protein